MSDDSAGIVPVGERAAIPDIVVGLGARHQTTRDEILALVDATLAETGRDRSHLAALATRAGKDAHPALRAAAAWLDLPLYGLPDIALSQQAPNPSDKVLHHFGLPSIAEAAALAFGPLLVEKRRSANATCALSLLQPAYSTPISSALSAASTLSTSSAGP